MTEKVPQWFTRLYLKVKGWQDVLHFSSDATVLDQGWGGLPEHPVKWLWARIQDGETPTIGIVHSWDRQVGRDTGDMENWHRWLYYTWNPDKEGWELTEREYNNGLHEVYPPLGAPRIGSVVKREDLRNRRRFRYR